ncbi:RNA polymerase sigma factor [Pontibacter chitinilyticus]|uniref:RNA polymerase sigma factor n=1 Tax=Pontibacter chitinilyticus TaxID=2674989 RepID=UPI00321B3E38
MTDFKEIYETYAPKVFRVCMGYINDQDEAKDLTQKTFISVWENLPSFRHQAQLSTWIFRIATNNCLRALEKTKRRHTTELPFQLAELEEEPQEEKLHFLYSCIAQLPETERIIVSLVLEDVPQAEIAVIVGLSSGNVRVKIHRIKEKLALKFKAHGQFE